MYGAAGNAGFRFYDARMAEAITLTGQYFIKAVGNAVDSYISKIAKKPLKSTFYQDTDSCYVSFKELVEQYILPKLMNEDGSYDIQKVIDSLDKIANEKITPVINAACDDIASYTNSKKQVMNFKREAIADRGIWCLHPDTMVIADGVSVPIGEMWNWSDKEIEDGIKELVIHTKSVCESNNITDSYHSTHIYRRWFTGNLFCIITPKNIVKVTPEHEIAIKDFTDLDWVEAQYLRVGDELYNGEEIIAITNEYYEGYVYDLGMSVHSNFYANGILVHNCAKKKYALNVYDNEGIRYAEPKVKVMGLEIVRSSTPAPVRKMLKSAVDIALKSSEKELQSHIAGWKAKFMSLSPEEIAFPRGVNNLASNTDKSNIFKQGCPIQVRAALLFNHYVTKKGLNDQYPLIEEGSKIKFLYMKVPNPIRENVLGFIDKFPREVIDTKWVDYETMWEKAFLKPLESILGSIGWDHEEKIDLGDLFE